MSRIKILVSFDLPKRYLCKIQQVSQDVTVIVSSDENELLELIKDTDIMFAGKFSKQMFLATKKLKWIHFTGAGIDKQVFPEIINSNIILTNSRGIFSTAISEHTLMFMLMFNRKMNLFFQNQASKQWNRFGGYLGGSLDELEGKTLGIIGFGGIGQKLARKAKCLGMNVIATKRNQLESKPAFLDELIPVDGLRQLLVKSDFVVLTLPLTAQTKGLIGEEELKAMKKTSYLINVSRGKIVQEDKLLEALDKGVIAGAALDTFEEEPLSQDNKLWALDNVIITPHVAGVSNLFVQRTVNLFCQNLSLFLAHESLINKVKIENGY
jgi:phosphoglycerate dehydrogenase-like enzyme